MPFAVRTSAIAALVTFIAAAPAMAADAAGWTGGLDGSLSLNRGNTSASTLNGALRTARTFGKITEHLEATGKNTETAGVRSGESYRATTKTDYAFSARDYAFVFAAWERDRFNGFEWQASGAAGYGRKLIDEDRRHLSVEAGPGYHFDELAAGDEDSGLFRVALAFDQRITDSATFTQKFEADITDDNTVSHSLTALDVKLNDTLALKTSLDIRRNSLVPVGTKNSDSTALVGLAWTF